LAVQIGDRNFRTNRFKLQGITQIILGQHPLIYVKYILTYAEYDKEKLLIALIEKFEQEYYEPGATTTPHSLLLFLMEQRSQKPGFFLLAWSLRNRVSSENLMRMRKFS
jgi:hypothetical protein